jgi:hypothetical protein
VGRAEHHIDRIEALADDLREELTLRKAGACALEIITLLPQMNETIDQEGNQE